MPTLVRNTDPRIAPLRVLTVDPDDEARALYRQMLGSDECDVVEASEGRDALVKALVRVPALVITELRLPLIDGIAFCEILRQDRTTANVPIVIATAETCPDELTRARQIADVVLPKPTRSEVLLKECARLLAKVHTLGGHFAEISADTSDCLGVSATVLRIAAEIHRGPGPALKAQPRYTTTSPPVAPPALSCLWCGQPLIYEISYIGGVNGHNPDQWDYFNCATCGSFQYRQRTRKLRQLRADEEQWIRRMRAMR